jgi:flagellar secretion chaperone FliS
MQAAMARAAQTYYQTHVQSQSPVELVVLLYDGMLRFMRAAAEAIERNDLPAKGAALSRALAVVGELQNSLNTQQGQDVAAGLDNLYTYVTGRLTDANIKNDSTPVHESIRLMAPLREAWATIASPALCRGGSGEQP